MSKINLQNIVQLAMTGLLSAAITQPLFAEPQPTEKCYGIVKAGMNDCATAKHSCAGSSTKNNQGDAFIFLPKGDCNKIVGGSLSIIKDPTTTEK